MNSYQDRLQPIQESETELSNTYAHYRNGSIQGSYNYGTESMNENGKVLNSRNYNNIPQQQQSQYSSQNFSLQKSVDQNQLVSKYLKQSKAQNPLYSQQKTLGTVNEDMFTSQNNLQSKPFLDENSIDLSFINFLNKDDGNAITTNTGLSRAQLTNRNYQSNMPSFNSNAQISTIQNINTSNHLNFPSQTKPSQIVQDKYNLGMQNINDLANLLVSNNHIPDKQIQPKFTEQNQNQKKPINQQYDEIMTKYSSVLQSSQDGKLSELEQPNLYHYNSVKVNENSNELMQFQDSILQPYGSDPSKSLVQEKKISQSESMNSIKNVPYIDTFSLQRQFTFENDIRNNSLQNARQQEFQGANPQQNLQKSHQKSDSLGYLNINQVNNLNQTPSLNQPQFNNSESNIQYNNVGQIPPTDSNNFDLEDNKVKKSSNQNYFINESYGLNQTFKQTPQLSKQSSGNQSLLPPLPPSSKIQQYDSIVSKYLPNKTQNIQQQYNYNTGSQVQQSLIGSSMVQTNGLTNLSIDGRNSQRDRSGSLNKLATASELLQNFSSPKNLKNEVMSPSSRQPLGILQNQLVQSSTTERFNILNSSQQKGIKESNTFQNYNVNQFETNSNQPYLSVNQDIKEKDELPQYKPILFNNNNDSVNKQSNTDQFNFNSQNQSNKNTYQQDYLSQIPDQINQSKNQYNPQQGFVGLSQVQAKNQTPVGYINFENEYNSSNVPQFTRFNNHMQQMNSYQNAINPYSQQISRKQSENIDMTKILQVTNENLNFQRQPSHEKLKILDSKSLLQLREQQLQQAQPQQSVRQSGIQQQQQYIKQNPYLQQSLSYNIHQNSQDFPQINSQFNQQQNSQNNQQKIMQQSQHQFGQQPNSQQRQQIPQNQSSSYNKLVYSQQPYLQEFSAQTPLQQQTSPTLKQKPIQMEMSKQTQRSSSQKQIPIPGNLSPIDSPRHKKINSINQIQFENELDIEINELVSGIQTNRKSSENLEKQDAQKMLKQSRSQPYLQGNNFGQAQIDLNKNLITKDAQKNILQTQASLAAALNKPKRKIFQDNADVPQAQKNKTLKMNQQMLKNVLNFNKNDTNTQQNSHKINSNDQAPHINQYQQTYSVKEVQFEERTKKSVNSQFNAANDTQKKKYYVPPKSDSPIKKYHNNSSSQTQLKQENSSIASNNNLDKPRQHSNNRSVSSVNYQNKYSSDNKNNNQQRIFNIYDEKSQGRLTNNRQTEFQQDTASMKSQSEPYQPQNDGKLSQRSNFGQSDAKNQIRSIETVEQEQEEKVKQSKMNKSKSSLKIFGNSHSYAPSNTFSATYLKTSETPKVMDSKINIFSPKKIFTSNNQQNQVNPNITENDRKSLQIAEQRIQNNNNQDNTSLAIPILCINCDNFYQQKEIENHICIPPSQKIKAEQNNQQSSKQSSTNNIKSTSEFAFPQTNLTVDQFNQEEQIINNKIQIISQKINEQPYSDEQNQIKLLIENILKPKITFEDLSRECRNLNELNKKVETIRTRVGLSLLILSQRSEVLIKDKIDLHRRRLFPEQNKFNTVNFEAKRDNFNSSVQPQSLTQIDDKQMSQQNFNHHQTTSNQFNPNKSMSSQTNFNRMGSQTNINNIENNNFNNTNSNTFNRQGNALNEDIEMDFNYNQKNERVQQEKQSANINNQLNNNQGNKIFTSNSPDVQYIKTMKFDTPSSTNSQMNFQSNSKSQAVLSPPAFKIFNQNNNYENSNQRNNNTQNNNNPKYYEQVQIDSMTNYSKKNQGSSNQLNKFDDASSQFSSVPNLESKDLFKQNKQKQFNESSSAIYKRQFYNLALNLKLKLAPNHPARDCIISEMYNLAEKQNIPENTFSTFIENYFKQFN